jgi:hypothetical protein
MRGSPKAEPLLKSTEELDAEIDAEDADLADGEPHKNPEDDAVLRESANVLIDYIMQTQQVASIAASAPDTSVQ